jgi:hypothetical protein
MIISFYDKFILTLQELFEIPNLKHQITGLLFGILVIGICLLFAICYLGFPLT